MKNFKELYEKAEVYMKLGEYLNAFNVYNEIVNENPAEIKAYFEGLKAISNNMTRMADANVDCSYPSGCYDILNEYVYRLKNLDEKGKYTKFIEEFQKYYDDVASAEDFLHDEAYFYSLLDNFKKDKSKIYHESILETYPKITKNYEKMSEKTKKIYQDKYEKCKSEFENLPKPRTGIMGFLFP